MKPLIVNLLLFVAGLMAGLSSSGAMAKPFIPDSPTYILEELQIRPTDAVAQELRELRAQLIHQPDNLSLAERLSRRYIDQARAEADPRYLGYAQAVLSPWWKMENPPSQVLILRATINQSNHHFKEALDDLSVVLKVDPYNAQAWLTRASIFRVQGNYREANHDCLRLLRLATELVTTSCISGVAAHNGRLSKGYNLLLNVLRKSREDSVPSSEKLWVLTDLAEMAVRAGLTQAAEAHFKEALAQNIADSYLLGAYSDFLLDHRRPAEVVSLLKEKIRADGLLLRLTLAEQQLKSPDLPMHITALRARFEASRMRGDVVHRREEARFTLAFMNDPQQALQLALANWAVQREPWDARIVLESAIAAHRYIDARPVVDWLAKSHLEDVQIARYVRQLNGVKKPCCG